MGCECEQPRPRQATPNYPQADDYCRACGRHITRAPDIVAEHLERFATCFPSWPGVPEDYEAFAAQVRSRVEAGQATHGEAWRSRDPIAEALEECADGAAYAAFAHAQDPRDQELLLAATQDFYSATRHLAAWRAKGRGRPDI